MGVTDLGNNLDIDPGLGALADNDGYTATQMPNLNGPAVDNGIDSDCPATDQRDVPRPQGLHCDIDAVETVIYASTLTTLGSAGQYTPTGTAFALPLSVHVTDASNVSFVSARDDSTAGHRHQFHLHRWHHR